MRPFPRLVTRSSSRFAAVASLLVASLANAEPIPAPPSKGIVSPRDGSKYPHVELRILVQPQLVSTFYNRDGSLNQAKSGIPAGIGPNSVTVRDDGTTTNTTSFRLRRTRIKLIGDLNANMRAIVELDLVPVGTGSIFARDVMAVAIVPWRKGIVTELSAGAFKVPLTYEVIESSRIRPFLERSLLSSAFFPAERDIGAWARTTIHERLTIDAAIVNGRTFGEASTGVLPDNNRGKDGLLRASYDTGPVEFGAGFYGGAGTLPVGTRGGSTRLYRRGVAHGEVVFHHPVAPALGQTFVYGQVTYGQNMDRGVKYQFALPDLPAGGTGPIATKHEIGTLIRVQQDVGARWLLGAHYETYTTNLALSKNFAHALGGLASFTFAKGLAMRAEYIYGADRSHAATEAAPLRVSHTVSLWMQARYE